MYFISRYSKLMDLGLRLSGWQRWLLSVGLLASITVLWYFFVYSNLQSKFIERIHQEHMLKEQQAVYTAVNQKSDQLEILVKSAQIAWNMCVTNAQEQAVHERLFSLFDLFGKLGIAVQAYYPRGSVDCGWYTKTSAQLHFMASFDELLKFCDALNNDNVPYQCQQIRLERRDNQIFVTVTVSHKVPKAAQS